MSRTKVVPAVICNSRGTPVLCGGDIPGDMRALVVERTTCPHANPQCACKPVVSIVAAVDGRGMARALDDYGGCVELAGGELLAGDRLVPTLEKNGLYMALSTGTAYSTEPAHAFCHALGDRLSLSDGERDRIELAVHEAVANGLLHGNLELSSEDRSTLEGFQRYCRKIEEQLRDPRFAGRRIEVSAIHDDRSVTVTVADVGAGYEAAPQSADPGRKSGRGLALMRELADEVLVAEGGRAVSMRFSR